MAVRKLAEKIRSPVLLFVGPPGVGKTSLGKSIARAMDGSSSASSLAASTTRRRSVAIGAPTSVHCPAGSSSPSRRPGRTTRCSCWTRSTRSGMDFGVTVVRPAGGPRPGAEQQLPGQLPRGSVRPVQGAVHRHREHGGQHPPALRDRMEMIQLPGYTQLEKLRISQQFLVPKQLREPRPDRQAAPVRGGCVVRMIQAFTKEAGVRNMEREIAAVSRKVARRSLPPASRR